jgi:DNA-directed RNA polymerase specialized sigma24 family protein
MNDDSVSAWLAQIKEGDRDSVQRLLERYFQRLTELADARLRNSPHLDGYEEDIALSAFKSLCLGAEDGRYPDLTDRDGLWRLLCVITVRKSIDLQRKMKVNMQVSDEEIIHAFFRREPTPDETAEMAEQVHRLLGRLDEPELRQIALWKVSGWTNDEIAVKLNCVTRSVERKLKRIRGLWQEEVST